MGSVLPVFIFYLFPVIITIYSKGCNVTLLLLGLFPVVAIVTSTLLRMEVNGPYYVLILSNLSCAFRFIYTGSVEVSLDIAQDLLRAADQYLLDGLKHLCEYAIAQVGYGISSITDFSFLYCQLI